MKKSLSIIQNNWLFLVSLFLLFIAGIIFLFTNTQVEAYISSADHHSFGLNILMINITFIGDAIFAICLMLVFFFHFKKRLEAKALLFAFLLSGIAIQLIKNIISSQQPGFYFEAGRYLSEQGSFTQYLGFPSGHTAMAFALAMVLNSMQKNKKWQLPVLAIAVLVGYSRIYLAQHSLQDILAGAFIGTSAGWMAVYLSNNDRRLKNIFKKLHSIENNSSIASPSVISSGKINLG